MPLPTGEALDTVFRRLRRPWLPGFALVSRDDLLAERLARLRQEQPAATALDAWLDAVRLNYRAVKPGTPDADTEAGAVTDADPAAPPTVRKVEWLADRPPGWIVPMPVGYGALSGLHPAGSVAGARDRGVPFRFVESLYSLGQWVSPHRLQDAQDLLWFNHAEPAAGLYRCVNHFRGGAALAAALNDL